MSNRKNHVLARLSNIEEARALKTNKQGMNVSIPQPPPEDMGVGGSNWNEHYFLIDFFLSRCFMLVDHVLVFKF